VPEDEGEVVVELTLLAELLEGALARAAVEQVADEAHDLALVAAQVAREQEQLMLALIATAAGGRAAALLLLLLLRLLGLGR
jgi:hypothetical protein